MKSRTKAEFGDFQTPHDLAHAVCRYLHQSGVRPAAILEPTCGRGAFLRAAADAFPARPLRGVELNAAYVADAARIDRALVTQGDFFSTEWSEILGELPDPLLVIGNPPWVTNAELSTLGSENVPTKMNHANLSGLAALTGKANFDISEWMLRRVVEWLDGREAVMAMLCKTSVARKLLTVAWESEADLSRAEIHPIDAKLHFGAAVDACLLVCVFSAVRAAPQQCAVFDALGGRVVRTIGFTDGQLIADLPVYQRWSHLAGQSMLRWRSGVKHDCTAVMELERQPDGQFRNAHGEVTRLEDDYVFPMLKTSGVAAGRAPSSRWMLVPQRRIGEDTRVIADRAPATWAYLQRYANVLGQRGSRIYRGRPPFSIFGVGDYTFSPWKVAISGFYKAVRFSVVGPSQGRPVVLDDLSYFLPCDGEHDARQIATTLNDTPAREFFESQIFWDAKRPITVDLLGRLRIEALTEIAARGQLRFA